MPASAASRRTDSIALSVRRIEAAMLSEPALPLVLKLNS